MVVIALTSHDLHLTPSPMDKVDTPSSGLPAHPSRIPSHTGHTNSEIVAVMSNPHGPESGIAFHPPTPTSLDISTGEKKQEEYSLNEAGPSSVGPRPIPPPPNPRRHRSGVLLSRARVSSTGSAISTGTSMSISKSWGDLSGFGGGLGMSSMDGIAEAGNDAGERDRSRSGDRRVLSESSSTRGDESDDASLNYWDNR
jgi:protein-serine/threonine kinase